MCCRRTTAPSPTTPPASSRGARRTAPEQSQPARGSPSENPASPEPVQGPAVVGRRRWWLDPEQVQGHASGAGTAAWASRSRVHVSRVCAGLDKNMAPWGGRGGIELVLNSRVAAVRKGEVDVFSTATGSTEVIPFGACVWSTGVAMHPLVKKLQARRAAAPPPAPNQHACASLPNVFQHTRRGVLSRCCLLKLQACRAAAAAPSRRPRRMCRAARCFSACAEETMLLSRCCQVPGADALGVVLGVAACVAPSRAPQQRPGNTIREHGAPFSWVSGWGAKPAGAAAATHGRARAGRASCRGRRTSAPS